MYEILLTRDARKFYEQADPVLARRINRCFERLSENPFEHPNIRALKGPFSGHYRYRMGDWRVIYRVELDKEQVIVLLIVHRKNAYNR